MLLLDLCRCEVVYHVLDWGWYRMLVRDVLVSVRLRCESQGAASSSAHPLLMHSLLGLRRHGKLEERRVIQRLEGVRSRGG